MSIDALDGWTSRGCGGEPRSLHAVGHEHVDRRTRPGLAGRPRAGARRPPRRRRRELDCRGGLAGIALTHDHADHAEAIPAIRTRSAGRGSAAAEAPPMCGSATAGASGRSGASTPGHAPDHLAYGCGSGALLHRRRGARRGQRLRCPRSGRAGRLPRRDSRSLRRRRPDILAPATGHRSPTRRPSSTSTSPTAGARAEALEASAAGQRGEEELLDARVGRRAGGASSGCRGHARGAPRQAGRRGAAPEASSARRRGSTATTLARSDQPPASSSMAAVSGVVPASPRRRRRSSGACRRSPGRAVGAPRRVASGSSSSAMLMMPPALATKSGAQRIPRAAGGSAIGRRRAGCWPRRRRAGSAARDRRRR